jgi:cadaverine:lysine antiporter
MTALMVLITLMNSSGGKASDLFGELTGIAVLLTMLPYFYSCVDLIRFEGINIRNLVSLICSVLGCAFCFIALMGASSFELAGTFIVSLIILMFYGRKMHQRQNNTDSNSRQRALISNPFPELLPHLSHVTGGAFHIWRFDYERYRNHESHGRLL